MQKDRFYKIEEVLDYGKETNEFIITANNLDETKHFVEQRVTEMENKGGRISLYRKFDWKKKYNKFSKSTKLYLIGWYRKLDYSTITFEYTIKIMK